MELLLTEAVACPLYRRVVALCGGAVMMKICGKIGGIVLLSFAISAGAALAQNPPSGTQSPPAAGAQNPPPAGAMNKKAISKSCSDQANAKGLHGKARKKFRSDCKLHAGKPQ
jgi:psiF repeat